MKHSTFYAAFLLLATPSYGLGINCRGSAFCDSNGAAGNLINLKHIVDGIQDRGRRYNSGQQVACSGDVCLFYQNGASGNADDTGRYVQALIDHGCKKCGSVPTQAGNDVSKGELTANYVNSPSCQGAC